MSAEVGESQDDQLDERKRIYEKYREDLSKRQISNAENLDKSVVTYSGAGLALSLSFLKDFIPIENARFAWALYASWACFTLAMVLVVASYVLSLKVLNLQLDRAERHYLQFDEDAATERGRWDKCADHVNHWMSAAAFAVALVLTTFFVSTNLRGANMAEKKAVRVLTRDGVTGMSMQKAFPQGGDMQKGMTGMPMQSVPPSKPTSPAPSQPTQGNSSGQGSGSK